jgi:hypothetical protein
MLFEMPGRESREWDRFEVRNIGLATQRRMAKQFGSNPERLRHYTSKYAERVLGVCLRHGEPQTTLFNDLAIALSTAVDVAKWSHDEKKAAAKIFLAKSGADETQYLRQMQKHALLRASLIRLGCRGRR